MGLRRSLSWLLDPGMAASLSTGTQQIVRVSWPQAIRVTYSANQSLRPCFLCGKLGHFRKSCPLLQGSSGAGR